MKTKIPLCLIAIISLLYSCTSDFIEANISKKNVVLLTPVNGYASAQSNINFVWEEVKGAINYRLQVASPSFAALQQFALDTVVGKLSFTYALNSGQYECRLKAQNGSSYTPYVYSTFSVDSGLNISKKTVLLNYPRNDSSSNAFKQRFNWFPIKNADYYILDIYKDNIILSSQSNIQNTYADYTFPASGIYTWTVTARNNLAFSIPAKQYTIRIDNTAPNASTPLVASNDTASNPVHLSWARDAKAIGDSIYISVYPDTNTVIKFDYISGSPNYLFTGTTSKIYQWKLKSKDRAGNVSAFSSRSRFKIVK